MRDVQPFLVADAIGRLLPRPPRAGDHLDRAALRRRRPRPTGCSTRWGAGPTRWRPRAPSGRRRRDAAGRRHHRRPAHRSRAPRPPGGPAPARAGWSSRPSCCSRPWCASLVVGSRGVPPAAVLDALLHGPASPTDTDAVIVLDQRLPRTLLGLAVGVALGAAGALMQALTRNPLADPGVLGINWGASAAIVGGIMRLRHHHAERLRVVLASPAPRRWPSLVYVLGASGRSGATPARLALAGTAVGASLQGVIYAVVLRRRHDVRPVPGVARRLADRARPPGAGAGAAVPGRRGARRPRRSRARSTRWPSARRPAGRSACACGAPGRSPGSRSCCSAAARPRRPGRSRSSGWPSRTSRAPSPAPTSGGCCRTRWCSAGVLVVAADVVGRVVVIPAELEVGVVTAFVGAPVFLAIARRRRVVAL